MAAKRKEIIISKEQTDKLIELFEQEEDLWNISSDSYHKKEARYAAHSRIKEKTNDKFDGMYLHVYII